MEISLVGENFIIDNVMIRKCYIPVSFTSEGIEFIPNKRIIIAKFPFCNISYGSTKSLLVVIDLDLQISYSIVEISSHDSFALFNDIMVLVDNITGQCWIQDFTLNPISYISFIESVREYNIPLDENGLMTSEYRNSEGISSPFGRIYEYPPAVIEMDNRHVYITRRDFEFRMCH